MAKAEILKDFIKSWEGGYCNVPGDKGGHTNMGVTLATYREVFGQERTVEDLKTLTDIEWMYIFEKYYWEKWKADEIEDQSIANLLVDWVWASGVYGIRIPQYTLGVEQDGIVGPKTLAAINSYKDKEKLFKILWQARRDYFIRIGKGTQKKFLNGWLRRLDGIRYRRLVCNGGRTITF